MGEKVGFVDILGESTLFEFLKNQKWKHSSPVESHSTLNFEMQFSSSKVCGEGDVCITCMQMMVNFHEDLASEILPKL